jgi:hypothetical protein
MFLLSQAQEQVSRQVPRDTLHCGTARSAPWAFWCCRRLLMSVDPHDLSARPATFWCGLPSCSCLSLRVTGVDWLPSSPYPGTSSLQTPRQHVHVPSASSLIHYIPFHSSKRSLPVNDGSEYQVITFAVGNFFTLGGAGQRLLGGECSSWAEKSPRPARPAIHEIALRCLNRVSLRNRGCCYRPGPQGLLFRHLELLFIWANTSPFFISQLIYRRVYELAHCSRFWAVSVLITCPTYSTSRILKYSLLTSFFYRNLTCATCRTHLIRFNFDCPWSSRWRVQGVTLHNT